MFVEVIEKVQLSILQQMRWHSKIYLGEESYVQK